MISTENDFAQPFELSEKFITSFGMIFVSSRFLDLVESIDHLPAPNPATPTIPFVQPQLDLIITQNCSSSGILNSSVSRVTIVGEGDISSLFPLGSLAGLISPLLLLPDATGRDLRKGVGGG